jgi:hypothetical protein
MEVGECTWQRNNLVIIPRANKVPFPRAKVSHRCGIVEHFKSDVGGEGGPSTVVASEDREDGTDCCVVATVEGHFLTGIGVFGGVVEAI